MPFDKLKYPEELWKERRKGVQESLGSISVEELKKITKEHEQEFVDDPWRDEFLRLIAEQWAPSGLGGILHCFTGNTAQAKRALDMGFMVSFAGNITFPKAQQIRDAALAVPLDRILIETDSPFLSPPGAPRQPSHVLPPSIDFQQTTLAE